MDLSALGIGILTLAALGVLVAATIVARAYLKYRGRRVIVCPDNHAPAAVDVNATRAAVSALGGGGHLRLSDCSRWPEKKSCGQECLAQIEAAPEECLVRTRVTRWYEGKACVFCGRVFAAIPWEHHRPALLDAKSDLVEWQSVRAENLAAVMETHRPVCWDCLITETVRRGRPDLITYRPGRSS